jgi:hypothetical protein
MYSVGKFDIFKKYDFVEISMFDTIIAKNCIKATNENVRSMLEYSIINNSELFNTFHVEIYGSFNSNKRENANDVDMRIHIDYPFVKNQLDILEPLIKKQIDISYNKFQILLDISAYSFDKQFHTTNKNYIEYKIELGDTCPVMCFRPDYIKFDNDEYRFIPKYYYKKYCLSYSGVTEKHKVQIDNNQYTICTKIESIDDINNLYNKFI